jgi:excisionase family DNA binding protein
MSAWSPIHAAEFLDLKPKAVRAMAARGELPAAKIGRQWRFDETALREWFRAKNRENVKDSQCPSPNGPILRIGKSDSRSLATKLDDLLKQETDSPHKS